MGGGIWGFRGAEPSPQLGVPEDCPLGGVDFLGQRERDLEVSEKARFPSLPIYLYGGEGTGERLGRHPKSRQWRRGDADSKESRGRSGARPSQFPAWTPLSHPRASVRTTLCFPGLEGHGLSKRFSLEKSWESSPFLCAPPPNIAPLTRSNTHTLRALLCQAFPPGQITL